MQGRATRRSQGTLAVITSAGPLVRLNPKRRQELGRPLQQAAHELALASAASPLFTLRRGG